jgi:hypothetical protein
MSSERTVERGGTNGDVKNKAERISVYWMPSYFFRALVLVICVEIVPQSSNVFPDASALTSHARSACWL